MPRIILLLLVLALGYYLFLQYRKFDVDRQKRLIRGAIIVGLGGLLLMLALSGKLSWVIAGIGALLPLIPRFARFFMGVWPTVKPFLMRYQQNRQSSMQTRFLHLQIDMLTGKLQGEVLQGEFSGKKLAMLSPEQLLSLLQQCRQQDAESASLLMAYLDRMHPDWNSGAESKKRERAATNLEMDEQQARDVLGVTEKANKKEIIKAHKSLMQKMHPDRGGSEYLAQQINKARDTLLKGL